jgi:hypothetical protein
VPAALSGGADIRILRQSTGRKHPAQHASVLRARLARKPRHSLRNAWRSAGRISVPSLAGSPGLVQRSVQFVPSRCPRVTCCPWRGLPLSCSSASLSGNLCSRICPLGATQDLLALVARRLNAGFPGAALPARRAVLTVGVGAAFLRACPEGLGGETALPPPAWKCGRDRFQGRVHTLRKLREGVSDRNHTAGCRSERCIRVSAPTLRFSGRTTVSRTAIVAARPVRPR